MSRPLKHFDRHGITQSMSRKANCCDNATMEPLWATLKAECFGTTLPDTRAQARSMVFNYIEAFYNPTRLPSALNFLSPASFSKKVHYLSGGLPKWFRL